ncbi:MAG TPA: carboxypeptidase regulatory-like domain-containing protein, partial [Pyrinomonadaceae bacterium]|nr:carboxypeptidase regulatory-like domain-containing protein [Pyrinomonadaceae bacterium]
MKYPLRYVRAVFVALALLSFSQVSPAQETTGVISGTVKDANGAAVSGATVTISDADKKVEVRTIAVNENGEFVAPNLLSGFYDVTIEAPGFKKSLLSRVKLDVSDRRTVDVILEAGNITESVLVESAPVAVELTTATTSTVINGDQVRQLSINNRNFVQLVTLAPGVSNDLDDLVFTGTNNPDTQVVNRTLISVNGARSTQNTFTVDGADVTDRGSNLTIQAYPSIDSIAEFKVLRSLYPAESGRSGGGQVNIITKSGGEEFHGTAFEFIRNEAFNANDFQSNRTPTLAALFGRDSNGKIRRKPFRYNNYGFTVGGPVYFLNFGEGNGGIAKKLARTFFFFSEEQRRDTRYPTLSTRNVTGGGAVPSAQMKQGVFPIPICLSASSAT